jgi:hypothetical protein
MSIALNPESQMKSSPGRKLVGAVAGVVGLTLRVEGGVALALLMLVYRTTGESWWQFAALFFLPDLTMLGYLANRRIGAALYNIGHTYVSPAVLALAGIVLGTPALWGIGLIWGAHIGFDRLMGYGLKYPCAFQATHLGWRGKGALV